MAAIFDPRYKLQFVEFSYKKLYGVSSPKFSLFKEKMYLLFKEYTKVSTSENDEVASTSTKHSFPNEMDDEMMEEFNALDEEFGLSQQMSQLDRYLEEPRMDVKFNLDILTYWKGEQYKYPQVAAMACDILSIPITTVSSESVFSVGSRVLDPYRSSLSPTTVEAIICTRDWMFDKKGINEDVSTEDLVGDSLNVDDSLLTSPEASSMASLVAE